jgi:hypothetical protein
VIVIEVQELPLISEIKFQGPKGVDESVIFEALRKSGMTCDRVKFMTRSKYNELSASSGMYWPQTDSRMLLLRFV